MRKVPEYQRMDMNALIKKVNYHVDTLFYSASGLNIQKLFYKKKDFLETNPEESEVNEDKSKIIDKYGEELVTHKSSNMMN